MMRGPCNNLAIMLLPLLLAICMNIEVSAAPHGQSGLRPPPQNSHEHKSPISALKPSTIPYYFEAKQGKVKVHEEGVEGTLERTGLTPVGRKLHFLNMPTETVANHWAKFLCENLADLDAVNFPAGKWPQVPGKNCTLEKVNAFIVDMGAFRNTAVVQADWAIKNSSPDSAHINATALLEINPNLTPRAILQVIGGLQNGTDASGSASLEFVTHKQIALLFCGYASQWQVVLCKSQGRRDINVLRADKWMH